MNASALLWIASTPTTAWRKPLRFEFEWQGRTRVFILCKDAPDGRQLKAFADARSKRFHIVTETPAARFSARNIELLPPQASFPRAKRAGSEAPQAFEFRPIRKYVGDLVGRCTSTDAEVENFTKRAFDAFDREISNSIPDNNLFMTVISGFWWDPKFINAWEEPFRFEFRWKDLVHIVIFSQDLPTWPMRKEFSKSDTMHYHIVTTQSEQALSSLRLGHNTDLLGHAGRSHGRAAKLNRLTMPVFDKATVPRFWPAKKYLEDIAGRYTSSIEEAKAFVQLAFDAFVGRSKPSNAPEAEETLPLQANSGANVGSHVLVMHNSPPSHPGTPSGDRCPRSPGCGLTKNSSVAVEGVPPHCDHLIERLRQVGYSFEEGEGFELKEQRGKRLMMDRPGGGAAIKRVRTPEAK